MKAIYVHLDPKKFSFSNELTYSDHTFSILPDYAEYSFKQTELFLKEPPILITNNDIEVFTNEIIAFYTLCKNGFPSFYKDTFWLLTLLRLYIVYLYTSKNNINEFIHLEYDNLIYSDLKVLINLTQSIYFTRVGPFCSSGGFVYCNSLQHFKKFINCLEQLLQKGENIVRKFTQHEHLSEMILIDLIHEHTNNVMQYLPILPDGIGSDNFDKLNVLFDGASYGQYIGGTNNSNNKGWYGLHHYVGQKLHKKEIEIIFNKQPFVIQNNKKIPILNLHIHSKKLQNYINE